MQKIILLVVVLVSWAVGYNPTDWKITPYVSVSFVELNKQDNFIVGGGAVYEVNREGQRINAKQLVGNPLHFARDNQGNEWFGTDKGLVKLTSSGEEKVYPYGETTIPHWYIRSLKIKDGNIYVGSGLYENGKEGGLTIINSLADPEDLTEANYKIYLVNSVVASIQLYKDEVWCVAWNFNEKYSVQKLFNGVLTKYDDPDFLYNPRFVRVDVNGNVWVGNGTNTLEETWISRFNGINWTKQSVTGKNIISGDIDANGNFLFSTSTNICWVNTNLPEITITYEPKDAGDFQGIFVSHKGNFLASGKTNLMEYKIGSPITTTPVVKSLKSVIISGNHFEILSSGDFKVNLFSASGKLIWNQMIRKPGKYSSSIYAKNLPSGMYMLNINSETEKGSLVSRFVITK